MTQTPFPWYFKLLFAAFGIGLALIGVEISLYIVDKSPQGTQFETLEDVRRAMLDEAPMEDQPAAEGPKQQISLRGIITPHRSDSLIYTLRPNLDTQFIRARVRTNSCGMRQEEVSLAKPPNTYRIALLGDSFAFGWGVEEPETFARQLEKNLNRLTGGTPRVEVLNFGVPGYSTFQEVALFEELALDFAPDAVLVYFVQNDFGLPFFIRDFKGTGGVLNSLEFVRLARKALAPGEADKQVQNLGLDPNRALKHLSKVARERGIQTYIALNPHKHWRGDLQRLWILKEDRSLRLVPLREELLAYIKHHNIPNDQLTLSFDPHPSPMRHALLGSLLAQPFMAALSSEKR